MRIFLSNLEGLAGDLRLAEDWVSVRCLDVSTGALFPYAWPGRTDLRQCDLPASRASWLSGSQGAGHDRGSSSELKRVDLGDGPDGASNRGIEWGELACL